MDTQQTAEKSENKFIGALKWGLHFLYRPYIGKLLLVTLIGLSVMSFIGFTIVIAQVDNAKSKATVADMKAELDDTSTVYGQFSLLFAILTMGLAFLVGSMDIFKPLLEKNQLIQKQV